MREPSWMSGPPDEPDVELALDHASCDVTISIGAIIDARSRSEIELPYLFAVAAIVSAAKEAWPGCADRLELAIVDQKGFDDPYSMSIDVQGDEDGDIARATKSTMRDSMDEYLRTHGFPWLVEF